MTQTPDSVKPEPDWAHESGPIEFPTGLPGFEDHKSFRLESRSDMRPFLWLRSLDDADVALPMINCQLLKRQAQPELTPAAAKLLGAQSPDEVVLFFILRVDTAGGTITANTKAPVLVIPERSQGYQVFLERSELKVDEPLINLVPPVEGE